MKDTTTKTTLKITEIKSNYMSGLEITKYFEVYFNI